MWPRGVAKHTAGLNAVGRWPPLQRALQQPPVQPVHAHTRLHSSLGQCKLTVTGSSQQLQSQRHTRTRTRHSNESHTQGCSSQNTTMLSPAQLTRDTARTRSRCVCCICMPRRVCVLMRPPCCRHKKVSHQPCRCCTVQTEARTQSTAGRKAGLAEAICDTTKSCRGAPVLRPTVTRTCAVRGTPRLLMTSIDATTAQAAHSGGCLSGCVRK